MNSAIERKLEELRAPFPDDAVGLKPVYIGDYDFDEQSGTFVIPKEAYGRCGVCGKYHNLPAKHLKFVGHARITERLNDVDPEWDWTPMATDDDGVPIIKGGCLWIWLTVCGITRIGVGDARGNTGADAVKEMIGDAIRNAAMRFGCGLEMWFEAEDDEVAEPVSNDAPDGAMAPFVAIKRKNATKAQLSLARELERLFERGHDAASFADELAEEFGRPYWEFNKREVDAAFEIIDAQFLGGDDSDGDSDEGEVFEV